MISILDSITLLHTKLRTRRLRLIVTVLVSALVFGLAIGAIAIVSGLNSSASRYAKEQYDGKYFIKAEYIDSGFFDPNDESRLSNPEAIAKVKQDHKNYIASRQAAAKRLGVPYDPSSEISPTFIERYNNKETIDEQSVVGRKYVNDNPSEAVKKSRRVNTLETINKLSEGYAVEKTIKLRTNSQPLVFMENDSESFKKSLDTNKFSYFAATESVRDPGLDDMVYEKINSEVLANYIDRSVFDKKAIPVVLPANIAVNEYGQAVGLGKAPADSAAQKSWYADARKALVGKKYSVCFRNEASTKLVEQAIAQSAEKESKKSDPNYQEPLLKYSLPDDKTCEPVLISDKRSNTDKQMAEKLEQFEKETNPYYVEPTQQKIDFQIVGLSQVQMRDSNTNLESFVSGFVGVSSSAYAQIPDTLYGELPDSLQHKEIMFSESAAQSSYEYQNSLYTGSFILQFGSSAEAERFFRDKSCPEEALYSGSCPDDRPFILSAYGSNYLLASEIKDNAGPVVTIILSVVAVVAGIIIMAMMGRVMADSRRETAVFRAIGASRTDISKVYILYSLAVAARIAVFAILLGLAIASVLEILYSQKATNYADVVFGLNDQANNLRFHFIGYHWSIGVIMLGIVIISIISVLPPLARNLRRNPINDMRDE